MGIPSVIMIKSLLAAAALASSVAFAADQRQFGALHTRNMASAERGLPASVAVEQGKGLLWRVDLGTESYATPVVAGDRVYIGTNNERPRDPKVTGDRGVLLCLSAATGAFRWQVTAPKRSESPYLDWPRTGMVAPPSVEGDRIYVVTNRDEVVCLRMDGTRVWSTDLVAQAGVHPHDQSHGSPLIDGPYLYVNTSLGVDDRHLQTPTLDAPALVVLEKATGRIVARNPERLGPNTIHCNWSPPALVWVGGRKLVVLGGGDGICYAYKALPHASAGKPQQGVADLEQAWRFDCDPEAPKSDIFRWQENRKEGPSTILSAPVVHNGKVYVTAGGDPWHGKPWSWVKCIDPSGSGDITKSGELWSARLDAYAMSTPAIADGLLYTADWAGVVHCLDLATGKTVWKHQMDGEIWSSTLVADGKVYIATRKGELAILAAGRTFRVLCSDRLDGPVSGAPVAANGKVYIATMRSLYALGATPAGRRR
jgi:outer membrane protein assembly factor BamB